MNQRSTRSVAVFWATLLWFFGLVPTTCHATVGFANPTSNLLLDTTNARLFINNPTKITGWTNRSIVKSFGDVVSSSWPEAYASNTIVAQTGGTLPARTNLVECNSNAIGGLSVGPRTTSNLLLYVARTYSSSLFVLRSRADSNNVNVRNTSNAVNGLYQKMAVPVADAIDGTVFAKYVTNHYVFHNGAWNARGWIRFNNGFTVMPQATVLMDTLTTVSGVIDLRDTGVLSLNNDLYLAHNVTLTSGGYIEGTAGMGGQANTIFMGGDLTLASDNYAKVLHITGGWQTNANSGDLVIDGCGHTLNIGSQAQIFVDQNITLTLRNMTIKTSPASFLKPAIQLASMGSKLALDNVMFDLGADFQFDQGQLFIHDEVAVTGTSAFIYSSPKPSYITSGATWSFETGTTFSIAPATYTDQPFTAGTATSNNFIVLADQSAALSLNNCSLKTTFTGARFTKGMVLFDNKVALDTQAGSEISGLGTGVGLMDAGVTVSSIALSPDGRYLAVGAMSMLASVSILGFNGTSLYSIAYNNFLGSTLPTLAWSPDGRFLAAGGTNVGDANGMIRIYRFNGISMSQVGSDTLFGRLVNSISWSPDGRYLAVGGNNGTTPLIIYRFDGTSLTQVTAIRPAYNTIQVNSVAWSPDGKYLAVTGRQPPNNPTYIQVYAFNGSQLSSVVIADYNGNGCAVAWSPDSRFLAFGWGITSAWGTPYVLRFDGTASLPLVDGKLFGSQVNAVAWSPDGRYLLACGSNGAAGMYGLYKVNMSGTTELLGTPAFGSPGVATTVAWSPDSKYVLIGGTNNDSGQKDLMVYPTTMAATAANTQGFSTGLVFGDKAKGVNFDANVQILGGAVVKVKGKIRDDSV